MKINHLYQPAEPWLLKSAMSVTDLDKSLAKYNCTDAMFLARLNGKDMTTLSSLFAEFGRCLRFPDYYGHNSAALEECLNDLDWISAAGYLLIFTNCGSLLANETSSDIMWLLDKLERVCEEWHRPTSLGVSWDRGPIPFHALFMTEPHSASEIPEKIASLPELG